MSFYRGFPHIGDLQQSERKALAIATVMGRLLSSYRGENIGDHDGGKHHQLSITGDLRLNLMDVSGCVYISIYSI